jgi:hypothetical protein
MGGQNSRVQDEISAAEQDEVDAPIFLSKELLAKLSAGPPQVAQPDDDYPLETFAGKGFFDKPAEPEKPATEIAEKRVDEILKRHHRLGVASERVCAAEEMAAKKCIEGKGEVSLDCAKPVEAFLQCSKDSLLGVLSSCYCLVQVKSGIRRWQVVMCLR